MEKRPSKNPATIHDKNSGQTRHTKGIPQYNKRDLQLVHRQQQPKCRESQRISTKIRNREKFSFSPYLFYQALEIVARAYQSKKQIKDIQS